MADLNWSRHFDRIVCFHAKKDVVRLDGLVHELKRVGILDSGIFCFVNTLPDPFEYHIRQHYSRFGDAKTNERFFNLGLATARSMREALFDGCGRVLYLEDDVRFLKDLSEIEATLEATPANAEIVQYDKFLPHEMTVEEYESYAGRWNVNGMFFETVEKPFYSGACFSVTSRAMKAILSFMERVRPCPADGLLHQISVKHVVAKRNMAIQVAFSDAMFLDYFRSKGNTHHKAYRNQGVRYEDYAVPDGYGYDSLFFDGKKVVQES